MPLTTSAGEWLEGRVPQSQLLHQHTELGDSAIFYAIPIAVLAVVIWWRDRQARDISRHAWLAPRSTVVTSVITGLALVQL